MSYTPENRFSEQDRRAMLALARSAVMSSLGHQMIRPPAAEPACFFLRHGLFVTLEVHGKLRGCIGVIEAHSPIRESIVHCARSAAFRDPRFSPLRIEEVAGLQIEISVLSGLSAILPEEIEIGRHGLLVATEDARGLLLPQVAAEHHLSQEEFLAEACHKAGLPRDAWRDPQTRIYGFTCEVFAECAAAVSNSSRA
ncbi:MAG TPA: AmmeMemoRadiSam system protein A [Candidatus Acidoferrum sp.]